MKIRTQLIVASVVLVAFAAGTAGFVVSSSRRTDAIARQSAIALELIRGFFEEGQLLHEYAANHEDRPKRQWYIQHEALTLLLASPALRLEPSASRLEGLRAGVQDLKVVFDELVRQTDSSSADEDLLAQAAGDVLVRSRAVTRMADDLATATFEARSAMRSAADRAIFALLFALAAVMTTIMAYLYRRIAGPLTILQKGTKIVGGGDLDHRIDSGSKDEFGGLARAFDAMAAKLKGSYDGLELKVKERTREIEELNKKNEILLKSIGDGVIAIDRSWNITLWNPATARLTGWSEQEALGRPFRERVRFIREHDRKENLTFIEEAMLFGEARQMSNSTLLLTRDGREIPVGDSAAPIFDETGAVKGIIIVFRDASKEKEASLLRTDFAYASHQLRTPVNKALWSLDLAIEEASGSEALDRLKVVQQSLKDVAKLSERLLAVSEIDQGLVTTSFDEVGLKPFLKTLSEKERKDASARNVKLVWPKLETEQKTDIDPKLLGAAIHELVQNAVLYSQSGGSVEVELQLEPLEMVLRVRDHGIGISDEQKPLIFTKFFRGQNIPPDVAGAGLGLFIARAYVRLMGGKLWFESELGKGSTFTISLPRVRGMRG